MTTTTHVSAFSAAASVSYPNKVVHSSFSIGDKDGLLRSVSTGQPTEVLNAGASIGAFPNTLHRCEHVSVYCPSSGCACVHCVCMFLWPCVCTCVLMFTCVLAVSKGPRHTSVHQLPSCLFWSCALVQLQVGPSSVFGEYPALHHMCRAVLCTVPNMPAVGYCWQLMQ